MRSNVGIMKAHVRDQNEHRCADAPPPGAPTTTLNAAELDRRRKRWISHPNRCGAGALGKAVHAAQSAGKEAVRQPKWAEKVYIYASW